ncbi:MAG: hypothetical protein H6819_07175 [Phycisphaerales bacterium]|nr:hypothetical protein [Phycisphaerales bacterium]MCB9857724.1 hypothetical protein [Phycisphaerales bacterium]MCB9863784.1 hypothetical protein [Phycisphaerales bacterium]
MKIALATCTTLPDWEVDDRPLEAAFRAAGVEIATPAWDDATIDWSIFDACLIRTTWDYSQRRDEFVGWADRVSERTILLNPARIVRWNTNKRYLRDLESQGVPTIPTVWLEKGSHPDVGQILAERQWQRAFLKPVVGASSSGTMRFDAGAEGIQRARAHLAELLPTHEMMLQPYYASVEKEGEYSVIFIDGQSTHAVRKVPVAGDYRVQDDYGAHDEPIQLSERDLRVAAEAVVRAGAGERLLYARADFLRAPDGTLRMNELEVVEPSLFFRHRPEAAETLAHATLDRVKSLRESTA